jgi:hypothetical protein
VILKMDEQEDEIEIRWTKKSIVYAIVYILLLPVSIPLEIYLMIIFKISEACAKDIISIKKHFGGK